MPILSSHKENIQPENRLPWYRLVLPKILAEITRRPRYIPQDIEWVDNLWTHNIFRAFEVVFGRAYGKAGVGDTIRREAAVRAFMDENGVVHIHRSFFTLEAVSAHVEGAIRLAWKELWRPRPEFGFMPQPVFLTLMILGVKMTLHGDAHGALLPLIGGAIAYDTSNKGHSGAAASSLTVSVSPSGSNRILLTGGQLQDNSRSWSSTTYDGNATTQIGSNVVYSANSAPGQFRYYIAPATGAHNVVFTPSGSITIGGYAATYTGVAQSTPTEGEAQGNGSASFNVTVSTANSWLVAYVILFNNDYDTVGNPAYVTLTSGITRWVQAADDNGGLGDSNGTVATGTRAVQFSNLNGNNGRIACALKPIANVDITVNPTTFSAVFSLIAPTITAIRNIIVNASTLAATFSIPTPTITAQTNVTVNATTLSATFSIPAFSAGGAVTVAPSTLSATFSIIPPTITVESNISVSPSTLVATFSLVAPSIVQGAGVTVAPNPLEATFSLIAPTIIAERSISIAVQPLTATFSLPELDFVGGVWRKQPQATDEWDKVAIDE